MIESARHRVDPGLLVGLVVVGVSAVIYWIAARGFDAGRSDRVRTM